MRGRKLLICSSGLPGAGKGVVAEAARRLGLYVVVMGDIVRRETAKIGLEPNVRNTAKLMIEYRRVYGKDIFARLTLDLVEKLGENVVLIDGVRSPEELEYFRKKGWNTVVIAVLASPKERFKRLRERKRVDDIKTYEDFVKRDKREIAVGVDKVLLYADKFLVNEGKTKEEAIKEAISLIKDILE